MLSNPSPFRMFGAIERSAGEPVLLVVGKIRRPHGLAGEALVEVYNDFPEPLLPNTVVFAGEAHQPLTIQRHRMHNKGLLLTFEGITAPEQVGYFRNQMLYMPAVDRPPLEEGKYYQHGRAVTYHHQMLGLSVVDESGQELGELTEILKTGANDVYVVKRADASELLLPAISEVVLDVDLPRKRMRVHLLPGLIEESEVS